MLLHMYAHYLGKNYTFLFSYTFQCQLLVVSLLRRLTDTIKGMITTNNFVNLKK